MHLAKGSHIITIPALRHIDSRQPGRIHSAQSRKLCSCTSSSPLSWAFHDAMIQWALQQFRQNGYNIDLHAANLTITNLATARPFEPLL